MKVVVVGAGVAGLACAAALARAGASVVVLDKGRRPGGRVATRRTDGLTFNHGAQYVTARGPAFAGVVAAMRERGAAADWPAAGRGRVAFRPGMSALPAYLADGLTVMTERHAGFLHAQDAGWGVRHFPAADMRPGEVASEGGEILAADAVVLAVPAPQATGLLTAAGHRFAAAAGRVTMAPCWAVMARFAAPVGGPDVLEPQDGPIAWAAREGSRPGADATVEAWMLHASPAWSRTHLEDAPDAVASALLAAFRTITGTGEAVSVRAHRWRYARVETPLGEPCLWDPARRLGLCGDWCIDGRVEAAFDSGAALAVRLTGG